MSNYPPGVTGNELQIAGPAWESVELIDCPECSSTVKADAWGHGGVAHFTCPVCAHEWGVSEEDLEPDPYDAWRDAELERD